MFNSLFKPKLKMYSQKVSVKLAVSWRQAKFWSPEWNVSETSRGTCYY